MCVMLLFILLIWTCLWRLEYEYESLNNIYPIKWWESLIKYRNILRLFSQKYSIKKK